MIITRTPFRVSFFGGGTDYPDWYRENGGVVLSTTIDKYCYLSVRHLPQFFTHKHRIVYGQIESVKMLDEIIHPSVRECMKFMGVQRGIEIHHDGDLPARAGMGTSSAFTVGLLNALHALEGEPISKMDLAMEAIHVEQDMINEQVGSQDQVACAVGGLNMIRFNGDEKPKVEPVALSEANRWEFESWLMLVFTGFPHTTASEVAKTYDLAKKTELKEMQKMTEEASKLLVGGNIADFGKLLNETWALKKSLSPEVSNTYIDYVYEYAMRAGAIGAKLLGAGGGGFMLLFVPPGRQKDIRDAFPKLLFVPFSLESKGSQVIFNNE